MFCGIIVYEVTKIYKNDLKISYKIYAKTRKKGLDKPMKLLYNSADSRQQTADSRQQTAFCVFNSNSKTLNKDGGVMKFKSIQSKLLLSILPIILISSLVLVLLSYTSSKNIIENTVKEKMEAELNYKLANIESLVSDVKDLSSAIANSVGATYTDTEIESYELMITKLLEQNELAVGSGIWFEPFAYDKKEKYVGPYILHSRDS